MTPHKQLFRHDPAKGVYGDCWRTVIACLLDLPVDSIPHEHRTYADGEQQTIIRTFLADHGLTLAFLALQGTPDDLLHTMGVSNPEVYWLLSGTSRTGCNHVVICRGGEIVHDTSLTDSGIVGPCDDGLTYVDMLVKL